MAYSKFLAALFLALLFISVVVVSTAVSAAECPPEAPPGVVCVEPWETVDLENNDRIDRLKRLAVNKLGFEFYSEYVQPEDHGLVDFPVAIPVLRVVAGQDVFFDSGSDVIRTQAYPLLDIVSNSLGSEPPDVAVFVAGHTDSQGDEEYNYELGLDRAKSVTNALLHRGVYQASVYQVSFGEMLPIATNSTSNGRSKNRRVEFLFAARPSAIVDHLQKQAIALCSEQDPSTPCKTQIAVEAIQALVSPAYESQRLELKRQYDEVVNDQSLSQVEVEERVEEIANKQASIRIEYSPVKIPITVGLQ